MECKHREHTSLLLPGTGHRHPRPMEPPSPTEAQPLAVCVTCPAKIKTTMKQHKLAKPEFLQHRGPSPERGERQRPCPGSPGRRVPALPAAPAPFAERILSEPRERVRTRSRRSPGSGNELPPHRPRGAAGPGPPGNGRRRPSRAGPPDPSSQRPRAQRAGSSLTGPVPPPRACRAARPRRPHRARRTACRGSRRRLCR